MLVSIGYSACHWCHVMERESFEDAETAAYMNEHFVPIKVDREERPDVDSIYMQAVQAMTGQGGWPLNVFSDPEGVPFFGGTYFPPEPRHGMPSFRQVLEGGGRRVANAPRRDPLGGARTIAGLSARGPPALLDGDPLSGGARRGGAHAREPSSTRHTAASAARRSSRRLRARVPDARGSPTRQDADRHARDGRAHARADGARRHLRPGRAAGSPATRWTPTGSCPTSRRCSTTTRCLRARTCTRGS